MRPLRRFLTCFGHSGGLDYPFGADQHPNEHPLQLTQETLSEPHEAVTALGPAPQYQERDDFIHLPALASSRPARSRRGRYSPSQ